MHFSHIGLHGAGQMAVYGWCFINGTRQSRYLALKVVKMLYLVKWCRAEKTGFRNAFPYVMESCRGGVTLLFSMIFLISYCHGFLLPGSHAVFLSGSTIFITRFSLLLCVREWEAMMVYGLRYGCCRQLLAAALMLKADADSLLCCYPGKVCWSLYRAGCYCCTR